jgi:hypothetical protein
MCLMSYNLTVAKTISKEEDIKSRDMIIFYSQVSQYLPWCDERHVHVSGATQVPPL